MHGPRPLKVVIVPGALLYTDCDEATASFLRVCWRLLFGRTRIPLPNNALQKAAGTLPHGARYFLIMVSRSIMPAGTAGSVAACARIKGN